MAVNKMREFWNMIDNPELSQVRLRVTLHKKALLQYAGPLTFGGMMDTTGRGITLFFCPPSML
jgi:hypothetical protein